MNPERITDLLELISSVELFRDMNREELEVLADLMEFQQIDATKEIFREGDPGGKMLVITSGTVEVQKRRSHGSGRVVIARFERGGVIGEMSLIDGMPRSATVVALQPTKYYYLSKEAMKSLIENHKDISIKLLQELAILLSLRLRNTSGWFADVF